MNPGNTAEAESRKEHEQQLCARIEAQRDSSQEAPQYQNSNENNSNLCARNEVQKNRPGGFVPRARPRLMKRF